MQLQDHGMFLKSPSILAFEIQLFPRPILRITARETGPVFFGGKKKSGKPQGYAVCTVHFLVDRWSIHLDTV